MSPDLAAPVVWTQDADGAWRATVCGLPCTADGDAPGYWEAAVRLPHPIGLLYAQGTYHTRDDAQAWCEAVARGLAAPWLQHCDALEQRVRELEAEKAERIRTLTAALATERAAGVREGERREREACIAAVSEVVERLHDDEGEYASECDRAYTAGARSALAALSARSSSTDSQGRGTGGER